MPRLEEDFGFPLQAVYLSFSIIFPPSSNLSSKTNPNGQLERQGLCLHFVWYTPPFLLVSLPEQVLSLTRRTVLPGVSVGWLSPEPCHASEPGRMADPSHQRPHLPVIPLPGSRSPLASWERHCVMETLMASQRWTLSLP